MPRPLKYPEFRIVRLPEGALKRIDALPGDEAQGEKLRRFVMEMLLKEESKAEEMPENAEFFARLVERRVNETLGGEASIMDIVELMIEMGWRSPDKPVEPSTWEATT